MSILIKAETGGSIEKAVKHEILEMIGLTRSSSQEVAEGYGPSIQKSELDADAQSQGYRLCSIRDIVEPATISLEERELFNMMYDLHNTGNEGSYNYRGTWNMLDQVMVSQSLLKDITGMHTTHDAGRIVKEDFMLYHNEENQQFVPGRTYGGPNYYGGISDHFPVIVTFQTTGD